MRPSLTVQLMSGVDVFAHVCERATVATICSHMTRDVSVFVICDTILDCFFGNYHKFKLLTFVR